MDTNSYTEYRDEHSFETVQEVVESLPERLEDAAPETTDTWMTPSIRSILSGLEWSDLERQGPRTMFESMSVSYEFERPSVRVWVSGQYESEGDFQKTVVRVVFTPGSESAAVNFDISPAGAVRVQ